MFTDVCNDDAEQKWVQHCNVHNITAPSGLGRTGTVSAEFSGQKIVRPSRLNRRVISFPSGVILPPLLHFWLLFVKALLLVAGSSAAQAKSGVAERGGAEIWQAFSHSSFSPDFVSWILL